MAPEGSPGAERPADDVMAVVRESVAALDGSAPGFRPRCYAELIALVPAVLGSTADHGRAVTDELTGQVFAAALSGETEGVVADRLGRVGAQLYRAGFPADGYQGAAHAVLRAARDVYPDDWDSSLSSAWVAYLGWAGDRLAAGAVAEQGRVPAAGTAGPVRTAVPASLSEVWAALATGPFAGNGRALDGVATRIALRTGADIRYPRMDQQTDPALVATVLGALARMGFALAGGPPSGAGVPAAAGASAPVTGPADPADPVRPARSRWWRRGRDGAPAAEPALRPRSRDRVPGRPDDRPPPPAAPAARATPSAPSSAPPAPASPQPGQPGQPTAGSPARVLPSSRTGSPRRTFDAFSRLGDAPAQPVPELVTAGGGRAPGTLTEVHERLRTGAFAGNEWALDGVLTRVALRTGADVRAPRPDQVADPAVVREVVTVLERMGYGELSGAEVERPRWWSRGRRRPGPNTLTSTPDR